MSPAVVVNGRSRDLREVGGHVTLLEWLRGSGLTGAKEGCAEGECGACAVLVARDDGAGGTRWVAINACLVPAAGFDQQEVVTAEGLGQPGDLHPVQQEMARRGGSQCGYCTPGFICAMAAEYYRPGRLPASHNGNGSSNGHSKPSDHEHGPNGFDLHSLSGNLCRCTGYRPIRDAAYALGPPDPADPLLARQTGPAPAPAPTSVTSDQGRYVRPADLAEALGLLAEHPDAQLVAGSTDWGVELNIRHRRAGPHHRHRPAPRAAGVRGPPGRVRYRRRPQPVRDRGPAGRSGSAAGRAVPPVRLPADPQRGHPGRQPRHRLPDRRHPAGPARPGRLARAGLGRRGP